MATYFYMKASKTKLKNQGWILTTIPIYDEHLSFDKSKLDRNISGSAPHDNKCYYVSTSDNRWIHISFSHQLVRSHQS